MTVDEFSVWVYLIQVAPVILVMGIAVKALWAKNNELIKSIQKKDEANLLTLENISTVLGMVKNDGVGHTAELKAHIDDRIATLKEVLK